MASRPRPPEPARFADPAVILAEAFGQLRPPEKLTVSEAALKYRILDNPGGGYSGPWTFGPVPYLRRPMDCLAVESGYSWVAVMGGAQCAKSEIGNNWHLHTIICDPADMIFLGPDKSVVASYMVSQVNKMIRLTPEVRDRQFRFAGADNIFQKQFRGCFLYAIWPVKSQLRARPVPRWRIDDYDAVDEDIEGEGNAMMLLEGRGVTFEGFTMGYVNSSPALGSERGIEAVVASGTDERWFVDCPQCETPFELEAERVLRFDRTDDPEDARASAHVACPAGCVIEQPAKPALMKTGRWVGRGQHALPGGRVGGDLVEASTASFRFDGLMGFATWGKLAKLLRDAEITFERSQDEGELRAVYNTQLGKNYKSRLAGAEPVGASELELRAAGSDYEFGNVPPWCICLTAAVDVQGNRFEVEVIGWGEGWRSARVDRFPILALDDGETAIDPARHPEHWGVLLKRVIWRRYPVQGEPERSLPVMCTGLDTGGIEGVTDNAFAFWNTAIRAGVPPTGLTLIKGGNNPRARLLPTPTVDARRKGAKGDPDPELFVPNVNRMKDIIDARLRRDRPGPGYMDYPRGFPREYLEETTAETKVGGLWTRPRGRANETLDLEVYNMTCATRLGGKDGSLAWVPDWARARGTVDSKGRSPGGAGRRGLKIRTRR
ncbi:MAG TPA: terminase gpA endonuclease subunit [Thermohalobaculum sp.]|nr:terminase gpA endonuclease subunit [Thermohalobaculum sp.]